MSWTSIDTVGTIGLGLFLILAAAFSLFCCCTPTRKSAKKRKGEEELLEALDLDPAYTEIILFYVIGALFLAGAYLLTTDYVGQGTVEFFNPTASRQLVVYGRVLLDVVAYGLWAWPIVYFSLRREDNVRNFEIVLTVLTAALVFLGYTFASLSERFQWIGGGFGLFFTVLFVFYVIYCSRPRYVYALNIVALIFFTIKSILIVLSASVSNVWDSTLTDMITDLVADGLLWTVIPFWILYAIYSSATEAAESAATAAKNA